jgi:gluconolactonase
VREYREIASDIGFTEGPLWVDGRLLVTSVSRGLVYEVSLDGDGAAVYCETGGGPNGLSADAEGTVWVAQNGGVTVPSKSTRPVRPGLQRISDGVVEDIVTEGCNAPNDLVQGPDGRIWFTDPFGPADQRAGQVRAYDIASGVVTTMLDGIQYPNGIAFNQGGDHLYVAETRTQRILRYSWDGDTLGPGEVFARLRVGSPDGMAFDVTERLYVAGAGSDHVLVFDRNGNEVEAVEFGGLTMPTNLAFIGDLLVVTAGKGGRVITIAGVAEGLALR